MKKLIFALTCLFLAIPCRARIITVDDDGPADFNNIQAAINDANDGDTILVADGTYYEIVQMKDGVNVFGAGADVTTIDGGAIGHVIVFIYASGSISGFTITNSSPTDYYAGIYVYDSTVSIKNNIVTVNQYSIRIFNNSNGIITGNKVIGNVAGISIHDSNMTITNNLIARNPWLGISFKDSSATIINNTINGAGAGAGIVCTRPISTHVIANNIITQNNKGIHVNGWLFGSAVPMLNISYNNVWDNHINYWEEYGDVEFGYFGPFTPKPGTGQINQDPLFADPSNADYQLKSQVGRWDPNSKSWIKDDVTSPCIDTGDPTSDWTAELWPHGKQINMGAYGGTPQASMSTLIDLGYIADLNNDDKLDFGDLKLFTNEWQNEQLLLSEDLDRNGFVDFSDFAIFGLQWSYPSASEPTMTYHIDDCNMEAGLRWTAAAESNEPRFKVWVECRYIYFEDQMYANCCPDELGLDKEINGNQIILYEIGYGGLCDCMCYFPITATLGPFEDGTYTVEVYDNCGNSLGVVEVTIGCSPEPGITFQIDECTLFLATGRESETRFTVTVEGLYVHFEDTMVANCCPDELGLEMTVEDNLITIYETEYTSEGCRCVCFYPVTATLGPFEPGTYTLEVYEYHDGFIGSTTVVIDPPP